MMMTKENQASPAGQNEIDVSSLPNPVCDKTLKNLLSGYPDSFVYELRNIFRTREADTQVF